MTGGPTYTVTSPPATNGAIEYGSQTSVRVNFSGLSQTDNYVFVSQCWKTSSDPGFDPLSDCQGNTGDQFQIPASGTGGGSFALTYGNETNLDSYACGATTGTAANGQKILPPSRVATTCYVRLAPHLDSNLNGNVFIPFQFGASAPPDVPEVPYNILLPGSAIGLLGGAYIITRKRRQRVGA